MKGDGKVTSTQSDSPRKKNPARRRAKRLLNAKLDQLQAIENREAELEGREPVDVISEYKRRKALEQNTIDVEIVEESNQNTDPCSEVQADRGPSRLPAIIPKRAEPKQDSNRLERFPRFSDEWWSQQPFETQHKRCRADKVSGGRCGMYASAGARVCIKHGAKAPAVKAAARTRLEMAADHLVQRLLQMPDSDEIKAETRLRAIDSALDRIGLKAPTEVVLSPGGQQPTGFDEVFEGIYSGPRTERGQDGSGGLGIESNGEVESAGSFDYRPETDTLGPVAQQQDQKPTNAAQYRNESQRGTDSTAGTPRESLSGADYHGYSEADYGQRAYGRPARPGAQVSGYEAMRIAREAQELSRRLAGLDEERFNSEM